MSWIIYALNHRKNAKLEASEKASRCRCDGDDIISFSINFARRDSSQFNWNKATTSTKYIAFNSLSSNKWRQRFFLTAAALSSASTSCIDYLCLRMLFRNSRKKSYAVCRMESLESIIARKKNDRNAIIILLTFFSFAESGWSGYPQVPLSMQISRLTSPWWKRKKNDGKVKMGNNESYQCPQLRRIKTLRTFKSAFRSNYQP